MSGMGGFCFCLGRSGALGGGWQATAKAILFPAHTIPIQDTGHRKSCHTVWNFANAVSSRQPRKHVKERRAGRGVSRRTAADPKLPIEASQISDLRIIYTRAGVFAVGTSLARNIGRRRARENVWYTGGNKIRLQQGSAAFSRISLGSESESPLLFSSFFKE